MDQPVSQSPIAGNLSNKARRDSFLQPTEAEMKSPSSEGHSEGLTTGFFKQNISSNESASTAAHSSNASAGHERLLASSFNSVDSRPDDSTQVRLFRTGSFDLSVETQDHSNPLSPTRTLNVSVHSTQQPKVTTNPPTYPWSHDAPANESEIDRIVNNIAESDDPALHSRRSSESQWQCEVQGERRSGGSLERMELHDLQNTPSRGGGVNSFAYVEKRPPPTSPLLRENPLRTPLYQSTFVAPQSNATSLSAQQVISGQDRVGESSRYHTETGTKYRRDHQASIPYGVDKGIRNDHTNGDRTPQRTQADTFTKSLNGQYYTSNTQRHSSSSNTQRHSSSSNTQRHSSSSNTQNKKHSVPTQPSWPSMSNSSKSSAPSSAVVSAMKALQERVAQLEAENAAISERNTELEVKLERSEGEVNRLSHEIELHLIDSDKKLRQSSKSAHEKVQYLESQVRSLRDELGMVREQVSASDAAKIDAANQVECLEQVVSALKEKLNQHQNGFKQRDDKVHLLNQEQSKAKQTIESLQRQLSQSLEQAGNVSELNECLLSRLSIYEDIGTRNAENLEVRRKRQIASSGSRKDNTSLRRPTASALGKQKPSIRKRAGRTNTQGTSTTRNHLQKARKPKVINRVPAHHAAKVLHQAHNQQKNLHNELLNANLNTPIPFLTASSPGNNTFSLYANAQNNLANSEAFGMEGDFKEVGFESMSPRTRNSQRPTSTSKMNDVMDALESELRSLHEALSKFDELQEPGRNNTVDPLVSCLSGDHPSNIFQFEKYTRKEVVSEIQQKQEQLYALQRLRRGMLSGERVQYKSYDVRPRSPVKRLDAYDKKVKSLQLLQQFRLDASDS